MGATNTLGRVASSLGALTSVEPRFTAVMDVSYAGVLFALPALLACGLLDGAERYFQLPHGYYRLDSIFILLAFMALARVKTADELRRHAPGEWGKLLGLDRIPEAKTLREKIGLLAKEDRHALWAAELSRSWMTEEPDSAGVLYVDGHVRVYSGSQTELPRHYVSRQKLCLRATVDYWVGAMDGRPFFLVNKAADPGLISTLEEDIIPRLERDVPNQPTDEELAVDPLLHRFTVVFDREGYSPALLKRLKAKRIACITYRKCQGEDWPQEEFLLCQVVLRAGNLVEMRLAEREVLLSGLRVREVRKLTESGHQTAIVSTDYKSNMRVVAAAMFARWSQENFLKYMRNHYNLDRLISYETEAIPETTMVVNPAYRALNAELRKERGRLDRLRAQFGTAALTAEIDPINTEEYLQGKAQLQEQMEAVENVIQTLKAQRKQTKKRIPIGDLPPEQRFRRLDTHSKFLIDTIKMIAYRAETAMASQLREEMSHPDEARTLLQALYQAEADLLPDEQANLLTVRLHHLANKISSEILKRLCEELNATETVFPGTNLQLKYILVS